ncbi:MAG: hypothetical protein M3Y52_10720 [Actinomycetota bacterium]|nr:hypothetical protein [Actinomycetota bacterium]
MAESDSTNPVDDTRQRASSDAERMPLAPPREDGEVEPAPPARPVMSDQTKPPVLKPIPMPKIVKIARTLWILSFVLGGAAVFIAFLSRDALVAELTTTLGRLAPGYDEGEVAALVDLVYWSSIAGMAVVIAIEAVLLGILLNRRGGARWVQVIVLALHAGAVLVASAFLAIGDWAGPVELLLLAGLLLAFAGWVVCLFPAASRWLRVRHEPEALPLD